MAKFLITGSKGQVGHCLVQQLTGKTEFLAVDRNDLDITNPQAVTSLIESYRPDVIINAAAYTAVDKAETETELCQAVNEKGALYLAEASAKIRALLLHISTDYVFNGQGSQPYVESDPTDPQSIYGKTKLAGEIAIQQANPRSVILRTAWVFGEIGNNFVKTMIRLGKERDSLGVVADQKGSPTYAGDIATALINIAEQILAGKNAFGIYHFSGLPYVSWYDFAQTIFAEAETQKILEKRPLVRPISTADYPTPAKRPFNSCLDLSKIEQTFGIKPSNWQQALKNIKAYG